MADPAAGFVRVAVSPTVVREVRERLLREHGLDVDASTALYLARRLEAEDEEILSFPASDAVSGDWAFRVLPASMLRGH